jgi:acyl carrier protein
LVTAVDRAALTEHRVVKPTSESGRPVQRLVGCGHTLLDEEVVVVHPQRMTRCLPNQMGEIWLRGPNVARGYWNRPDENGRTFDARLADDPMHSYLRTGDLGFVSDGQLHVAGRVKDVIIIRGRNYYPHDIELSVQNAHAALQPGGGAAFSMDIDGQERLVVVHEIDRQHRKADLRQVIRNIRRQIIEQHDIDVHAVVLIRQASLPRTTSGKAQRTLCRQCYLSGQLTVLAEWTKPDDRPKHASDESQVAGTFDQGVGEGVASPDRRFTLSAASRNSSSHGLGPLDRAIGNGPLSAQDAERLAEQIESWLMDWLVERAEVPADEIDRHRPFAEYGLDSLTAVELSQELEEWLGVRLRPEIAWNYPTAATMSAYLARQLCGDEEPADAVSETPNGKSVQEFEQLLEEIETLSESEALQALGREPYADG